MTAAEQKAEEAAIVKGIQEDVHGVLTSTEEVTPQQFRRAKAALARLNRYIAVHERETAKLRLQLKAMKALKRLHQ